MSGFTIKVENLDNCKPLSEVKLLTKKGVRIKVIGIVKVKGEGRVLVGYNARTGKIQSFGAGTQVTGIFGIEEF